MSGKKRVATACAACVVVVLADGARGGVSVPSGFFTSELVAAWDLPCGIAFAPDGSAMYVAEIPGRVRTFVNDAEQPNGVFLDLRPEINFDLDRGLLGLAVDPNYAANKFVYLMYVVDPVFGQPDELATVPSFSRITRYTATAAGGGVTGTNRLVLLGNTSSDGIPACYSSHAIGSLQFGPDGMLLASNGDSAKFEVPDGGGLTAGCVLIGGEDIGAFRSQHLDSLNGKILRLNPANGQGLADNPFYTGVATADRSRVWISGLRNPFRFCVQPGSKGQGTVMIGDVGWNTYEEFTFANGGDNCGWPCIEGPIAAPFYHNFNNAWDCDTLDTPSNPGPVKDPVMWFEHNTWSNSNPQGPIGHTAIGGVFYTGTGFPLAYQNAYFYADYSNNWIRVAKFNAANQYINGWEFSALSGGPVGFAADPVSGDIYLAALNDNTVYRISYSGPGTGDVNGDFLVNIDDLTDVILNWGPSCLGGPPDCPADIDGDGDVDIDDLTNVILNWNP